MLACVLVVIMDNDNICLRIIRNCDYIGIFGADETVPVDAQRIKRVVDVYLFLIFRYLRGRIVSVPAHLLVVRVIILKHVVERINRAQNRRIRRSDFKTRVLQQIYRIYAFMQSYSVENLKRVKLV